MGNATAGSCKWEELLQQNRLQEAQKGPVTLYGARASALFWVAQK
jgi:hypothetical protein